MKGNNTWLGIWGQLTNQRIKGLLILYALVHVDHMSRLVLRRILCDTCKSSTYEYTNSTDVPDRLFLLGTDRLHFGSPFRFLATVPINQHFHLHQLVNSVDPSLKPHREPVSFTACHRIKTVCSRLNYRFLASFPNVVVSIMVSCQYMLKTQLHFEWRFTAHRCVSSNNIRKIY